MRQAEVRVWGRGEKRARGTGNFIHPLYLIHSRVALSSPPLPSPPLPSLPLSPLRTAAA